MNQIFQYQSYSDDTIENIILLSFMLTGINISMQDNLNSILTIFLKLN